MWGPAGREDRVITEQRIEDPGQAAGEGDDSHLFPAARGDAQGGAGGANIRP